MPEPTQTESALSRRVREIMARGLPRVINLDLSKRLGADSLLFFGEPRKFEQDSVQAWAFQMLAGAPGSLVFDQFRAGALFAEGEFVKGAALLPMPKILADTITATQKGVEGTVSTRTGKQTQEPLGVGTVATNVLGFKTGAQSEAQESQGARFAVRGKLTEGNQRATVLKNQYAEAKTEGDRIKVMARVREFNKTAPEADRLTPEKLRKFAKDYQRDVKRGYAKDGFRVRSEREARQMDEAAAAYNVR